MEPLDARSVVGAAMTARFKPFVLAVAALDPTSHRG
jgi:hypothetical protein